MTQKTFMMLKPDAFASNNAQSVLNDLEKAGLHIVKGQKLEVNMEIMKTLMEHYSGVIDSMDKGFNFPGKLFNSFYYEGPHHIMPMEIAYDGSEDIIEYSRALVGKTNPQDAAEGTIRHLYSDDNYDKATAGVRLVNNVIHASDSQKSAQRELEIWEAYLK